MIDSRNEQQQKIACKTENERKKKRQRSFRVKGITG